MEKYPQLTAEACVDPQAECLFRFVYGEDDIFNPHSHDFYELFLTVSGTVTHFINGVTQKLPEGSLVFIRPRDTHGYRYDDAKSKDTAYINLTFTADTCHRLFGYLSEDFPSEQLLSSPMPPSVVLSATAKQRLVQQISQLNCAEWADKTALKLYMRALLADIFVKLFRSAPTAEDEKAPLWLTQLMLEMERPENFIAGTDTLSELSGKSREHISRCFRQYCGVSATEYINDLRISYASNLLVNTNLSITDVCFSCGFQSLSYFYRVFKARHARSPREFRLYYRQ